MIKGLKFSELGWDGNSNPADRSGGGMISFLSINPVFVQKIPGGDEIFF
jgi:hypothetical protein